MSKNTHHTLWTARNYRRTGRGPLLLREHWAMKHETEIWRHNDLHACMAPLPVISRGLVS